MSTFILQIVLAIILILAFFIEVNYTNLQAEKKRKEQLGILESYQLLHLYGHPYIKANNIIELQIKKDNTLNLYQVQTKTDNIIPINQITRYEIKTESEIQKDVTLTRLLALGIFAFGLKKKTEINNSYLILSYVQNNVPIDCVFKNAVNNQQLGNIISTLNRLKIEQSNIENNYQTV